MCDKLSLSKLCKDLAKRIFIYCFRIKRLLLFRPQIPILFYHQICDGGLIGKNQRSCVSPKRFNEQMEFLYRQGYLTLTLNDVCDWIDRKKKLPKKSVCITFDDGHRDNFYIAFPVLEKYGFKATIFIAADQVGREIWYSRKLKKWERAFDDNDDLYFEFLTWQQIREMDKHGISFQSHTYSHPYLTELPRRNVKKEIKESKDILERNLGKSIDFLSYPYGDYNNEIKNIIKEYGYRGAVACDWGVVSHKTDKFALKRQYVFDKGVIFFQMNLYHLDPIYDKLSNIVKSILK